LEKLEKVVSGSIVSGVTLTGSTRAGRSLAALAGKHLKKSVLELGGSDPFIILEDADVEEAAQICAGSRLKNAGQSCIGAKRIIVLDEVYDRFVEHFLKAFEVPFGDPGEEDTRLGPLARFDLRDELHRQVTESMAAGAECLLGGKVPDRMGAWYPATVLTGVKRGMPAYEEELFGPVAVIIRAADEGEALHIANSTVYGLGAAVFTQDADRGERIARHELDAGACFVNDFVRSDPRLPFGGTKASGYGRELSLEGLLEFVNVKTIWVN
jgi:succinate-semialdehyde dehydrogenase/glutarate-semialdehyde dehydrogenase